MDKIRELELEKKNNIETMSRNQKLQCLTAKWFEACSRHKYSYNFSWMGRPIIQFPQDMVAMQEIIWKVKPDLIIETGIAHGGSIIFYASMLELLGSDGVVLGIDIDIRKYNREEIETHPMFKRITLIEGSSIDSTVVNKVREIVKNKTKVLVVLDSDHTHEHVFRELEIYSPLVTNGSYLVVFDTIIEDMPEDFAHSRPWGKGNNPKTAVRQFLAGNKRFTIDKEIADKLLITAAPDGYLKCIKEVQS